MQQANWVWPNGKRIAVVFNVCLEAWSDGKAPGISPMGNPLPAGVLDTMAISWAAYGAEVGIYRLLEAFARHKAKSSVMVNAVIAERAPQAVKAVADGGHEVLSHSYAMDVIPALLSDEEERRNIERCTRLLEKASGKPVQGWLSPRGTSRTGDAASPGGGGLSLVRRRVRPRSPLREDGRQQEDRGDPARHRRQRHAVHEIRQPAEDDGRILRRGAGHRAHEEVRADHDRRDLARAHLRPPARRLLLREDHRAGGAAPDVWIGTRAEIADHMLAMEKA